MRTFAKWTGLILLALLIGLAIFVMIPISPTIAQIEPRESTRYWEMSGGYSIAYTRVAPDGDAAGPPVLFLHGGPGGYIHSSYIRQAEKLAAQGHEVYLYDQVGSGLSDRLAKPKDYGFEKHVDDLAEIIGKLGGEASLIGQSYGGILVSYLSATQPGLVHRAVLTSPGGIQPTLFDEEGRWANEKRYAIPADISFTDPPDASEDMGISSWPTRAIASIAAATTLNRKIMEDEEADGVLNTVATRITRGMVCDPANVQPEEGGGGFYSHGWSNWFGDVEDWRPQLASSPVPLLVVQGECDYIHYASAYEHAALAPRGRYYFIEDAGHVIWWEKPDAWVDAVGAFLSGEEVGRE